MQLFFEKRTLTSFLRVVYLMSGVKATSQLICRLASMHLICNPIHECAAPSGRPTSLYRKLIWPYKRRRSRYARFSISTISYIFTRVSLVHRQTPMIYATREDAPTKIYPPTRYWKLKYIAFLRFILYTHLTLYVHFTGVLYTLHIPHIHTLHIDFLG